MATALASFRALMGACCPAHLAIDSHHASTASARTAARQRLDRRLSSLSWQVIAALAGDLGTKKRRVVSKPREHVSRACEPCRKSKVASPSPQVRKGSGYRSNVHSEPVREGCSGQGLLVAARRTAVVARGWVGQGPWWLLLKAVPADSGGHHVRQWVSKNRRYGPLTVRTLIFRSSATSHDRASAAAKTGVAIRVSTGVPTRVQVLHGRMRTMDSRNLRAVPLSPAHASRAVHQN